ncbi:hypothetical protein BKA58DRAFT_459976 [Alternaria rosae]|uniref:uncharacterized protein n=1 Tax=Alternaria rosae TaxID=1187941 RepID=UPI001E8DEDD2|nr:uncharacterized protein BKA58DRAFT_459976 [Alternaria rosae]KAH6866340.1 hypothetical protein BKA58DRAFT_459976 [Alternaria rosae]
MAERIEFFPLHSTTDSDLQQLGQCLWGWRLCDHCPGKPACSNAQCFWGRAKRQAACWTRYKTLTATYVPELFTPRPALRSHGDLLDLIQLIQSQPHSTREEMIQHHFVGQRIGDAEAPATIDQHRAMDLAASILFLVDCGNTCERANLLEEGSSSLPWRDGVSAHDFLVEAFPKRPNPSIISGKERVEWPVVTAAVSANELRRVLELRLEATTDLRSHLLLDRERGVLKVFHCTAMLKETLLVSRSQPTACMLPRQLILEVFDTIHNVLFPSDSESQALLSSLVAKHGFDEDLMRFESWDHYGHNDTILSYPYFGNRLAELYEELQNPKPRTRLESWFERKSGARYMLMATMIGVFIAVLIGILGLGISGFQAYVSYQQWKHPVKDA